MKHLIMILLIVCMLSPGLTHAAEHSALSDPFTLDTRTILGHSALSDPFTLDTRTILGHSALSNIFTLDTRTILGHSALSNIFTLDTRTILGHSALSNIFTLNTHNSPPVAEDDAYSVNEDEPLTVAAPGVLDNDTDADIGDTLTVASIDTTGTAGQVTDWNADGSFTYDPDGKFESLAEGEEATDTFGYTVSDGNGGTDTATVTMTITGVNDPPVAEDDAYSTDEDTTLTVAASGGVLANDTDVDASDTLTVASIDTTGTAGQVTDWNADGSFTYDPDGKFESLAEGEEATDTFGYTVSDGNGGTDTATVTMTITGVNDPPVADANGPYIDSEGSSVTLDGSSSSDVDGSIVLYEWDVDDDGTFDISTSSSTVSYVWPDDYTGDVVLRVTDDLGGTDTGNASATISNVAPTVTEVTVSDNEIMAGDHVDLGGSFSDPGWLDTHAAEWDFGDGTAPEAGVVVEENVQPDSTGTVTGDHSYFKSGEHTVTLTVTDDDGDSGKGTLLMKVEAIPATIVFHPGTFNRKGGGNWVTVYIELPIRGDVKKIGLSSILLNDKVKPETDEKYDFVKLEDSYITDIDEDGELERMVKFLRKDVQRLFKDDEGEVEVVITGCVEYTNDHGDTGCAAFKGTDTVEIIDTPEEVLAAPARVAPVRFQALAAFPQPCNPEVWLPYTLGKDVGVKVSIYSSSGKLIRTLDLGHKPAGSYTSKDRAACWDGTNEAGEQVASGIYFYTIRAGDFTAIRKMIVAR